MRPYKFRKYQSVTGALAGLAFFVFLLFAAIVPTIYGIYLSFSASIVLGIILLIAQPGPAILGWVAIFGRPDVAQKIVDWLKLPF